MGHAEQAFGERDIDPTLQIKLPVSFLLLSNVNKRVFVATLQVVSVKSEHATGADVAGLAGEKRGGTRALAKSKDVGVE